MVNGWPTWLLMLGQLTIYIGKIKSDHYLKKKIPSIMEGCEHWGIFFNEVYITII